MQDKRIWIFSADNGEALRSLKRAETCSDFPFDVIDLNHRVER